MGSFPTTICSNVFSNSIRITIISYNIMTMQIKSCRISVSSSYSDLSFLFHLSVALVHCKVCSKFEKKSRFRRCTPESSHGTIWNPRIGGLNCKCFPFSKGVFSSSMLVFGGVRPLLPPSIASYDSCHPFGARFSGHDSWALPGSIWQWLNHNRNLKLDVWFEELSCQGPNPTRFGTSRHYGTF